MISQLVQPVTKYTRVQHGVAYGSKRCVNKEGVSEGTEDGRDVVMAIREARGNAEA